MVVTQLSLPHLVSSIPFLNSTSDQSFLTSNLIGVFPGEEVSSISVDDTYLVDDLSMKTDSDNNDHASFKDEVKGVFEKLSDTGPMKSSTSFDVDVHQRRTQRMYREVLQGYKDLRVRCADLEEAKIKLLSYTPGLWMKKSSSELLSDYSIPKTTTLLFVGPKGSGKSSLINRISRVFEDDKLASDMAQVSYSSASDDGTYFLQRYMIPRDSTSFCLYDSCGLSEYESDNSEVVCRWMTKGVRNGEGVYRQSDRLSSRIRMTKKAHQNGYRSSDINMVNFVIFVVNGLSVLKSIDSEVAADGHYTQMIASTFNNPYLSFKDDKPIVVITHGDLLSLADRIRIRVHLGELLGISPAKQIFDIPTTELTIIDMLRYSLEHADKNVPPKKNIAWDKVLLLLFAFVVLIVAVVRMHPHHHHPSHKPHASLSNMHAEWRKIRHLWLDD